MSGNVGLDLRRQAATLSPSNFGGFVALSACSGQSVGTASPRRAGVRTLDRRALVGSSGEQSLAVAGRLFYVCSVNRNRNQDRRLACLHPPSPDPSRPPIRRPGGYLGPAGANGPRTATRGTETRRKALETRDSGAGLAPVPVAGRPVRGVRRDGAPRASFVDPIEDHRPRERNRKAAQAQEKSQFRSRDGVLRAGDPDRSFATRHRGERSRGEDPIGDQRFFADRSGGAFPAASLDALRQAATKASALPATASAAMPGL